MLLLTYQAKSVLRGIRKLVNVQRNHFVFSDSYTDGENCLYCLETSMMYDYSKYADEIDGIIDMLENEKCISVDRTGSVPVYQLTELGMHPYQIGFLKFKSFLIRSVFVPIAVSAITTLFTLWLKTR